MSRTTYQFKVSNKFNSFINDAQLLELNLRDRFFTWAKSSTSLVKALLDRFLCSISWNYHFANTIVTFLHCFASDHNPLILCTAHKMVSTHIFRFEKSWIEHPDFFDLFGGGQNIIFIGDFGNE
jgi:hypothetical protein